MGLTFLVERVSAIVLHETGYLLRILRFEAHKLKANEYKTSLRMMTGT